MPFNDIPRREFLAAASAGLGAAAMTPELASPADTGAAMPKRPLGKTGLNVSVLGFGAGVRYMSLTDEDEARRMIELAIEQGVNYFDTAFTYGHGNRESYTRFAKYLIPKYRKQVVLVSKTLARDAATAEKNLDTTLKELGVNYVDIWHFHAVNKPEMVDAIVAKGGALEAYRRAKDAGKAKHIGVTGHLDPDVLVDAIRRIKPEVVMMPVNPAHEGAILGGRSFIGTVLPVAESEGVGVMAMKVTGQLKLIGRGGVDAETLVRYAMTSPVAGAVIGQSDLDSLRSCARVAKSLKPMTDAERTAIHEKIAAASDRKDKLGYLCPGYRDGVPC